MGGQDAHPTRKFPLCGTGILPVLNRISGPPTKKLLFVERASCPFLTIIQAELLLTPLITAAPIK
ncbi:hypothetical protein D0A37_17345 [Microcoleus vaginatus HSN003]|nr:hypothetical protein D0A37_17345 [Microcoleus vaginatus HSN003]